MGPHLSSAGSPPLLLAPHNDDETLFAGFICARYRPHVIVVLRSVVQEQRGTGITAATREAETAAAMTILGCTWEQWEYPDDEPPWDTIERRLWDEWRAFGIRAVLAPAAETDGHEHHTELGLVASRVFTEPAHYLTYRRGYGRSVGPHPVVPKPDEIQAKLRALACYRSQIAEPTTQPHFLDVLHESTMGPIR